MNSRKGIKIRAFGCAMENSLKNYFQCLVIFWKCYFPTNFSHFISFQTNFILENPPPPTHQHLQKIDHYPHKTHHHTTQKPPNHHHPHHHNNNNKKKSKIKERKIERLKEREIGLQRRWRSSVLVMRSVLGGSRTRLVLGGDDENEMQGFGLDGGDVGAQPAIGCQDRSLTCTRRCMVGNQRGGSWVFVDLW